MPSWTREKLCNVLRDSECTFLDQVDMTHPHSLGYREWHSFAKNLPSVYGKVDFTWPDDWPRLPQFQNNYLRAVYPQGNFW